MENLWKMFSLQVLVLCFGLDLILGNYTGDVSLLLVWVIAKTG